MQLHVLRKPDWLLLIATGVCITSLPSAALSAVMFRRNQLALILAGQALTVAGLVAWFELKG